VADEDEDTMDSAELQKELRDFSDKLSTQIAAIKQDQIDALKPLSLEISGLKDQIAAMSSNGKDIERLEGDLRVLRKDNKAQDTVIQSLKEWRIAVEARGKVEEKGAAFWRGIGGKVIGAVLVAVILGGGGTLLAVWAMIQ